MIINWREGVPIYTRQGPTTAISVARGTNILYYTYRIICIIYVRNNVVLLNNKKKELKLKLIIITKTECHGYTYAAQVWGQEGNLI